MYIVHSLFLLSFEQRNFLCAVNMLPFVPVVPAFSNSSTVPPWIFTTLCGDPVHAGGKKRAVNPLHQVAPRMLRCPWFILQQKSNTFLTVIRKVSTLFPGVRECKNNGALEDSLTDGTRRWVSTGMHISIAVPAVVPKDARMVRLRFNACTVYVH